jgi:hypothetical protein
MVSTYTFKDHVDPKPGFTATCGHDSLGVWMIDRWVTKGSHLSRSSSFCSTLLYFIRLTAICLLADTWMGVGMDHAPGLVSPWMAI